MKINLILKERKNVLVSNFKVVFSNFFGTAHIIMNKR